MNRKELYENTVNKLLDAYNNGELISGVCEKCAVGNLCEGNNWVYAIVRYRHGLGLSDNAIVARMEEQSINVIAKTGYTIEEISRIERVFERACINKLDEVSPFPGMSRRVFRKSQEVSKAGLDAVLDLLKEIHEKEEVKIEQTITVEDRQLVEV